MQHSPYAENWVYLACDSNEEIDHGVCVLLLNGFSNDSICPREGLAAAEHLQWKQACKIQIRVPKLEINPRIFQVKLNRSTKESRENIIKLQGKQAYCADSPCGCSETLHLLAGINGHTPLHATRTWAATFTTAVCIRVRIRLGEAGITELFSFTAKN